MDPFFRRTRAPVAALAAVLGAALAPGTPAAILQVDFAGPAFRPAEPGPTRSSRAGLQVRLDADPSRYRLDAFATATGALVGSRVVEHGGPAGSPQTYEVRVPLDEGGNDFTARAVDLNRPEFALGSAPSPVITRDLGNTLTAVTLDRLEPTAVRTTSSPVAGVVFTIFGLADSYIVEVEQNGVVGPPTPGFAAGENRVDGLALVPGLNIFRVRVTSNDPLSSDDMVTSGLLQIVFDDTAPTLTNVVVANPPLPTDQAVVTIQGNTESFAEVAVTDPDGEVYTTRADLGGAFTVSGVGLPLVLPGPTTTVFTVTATDQAGNVSAPVALPATRTLASPRFDFLSLIPRDGAFVEPDFAARIEGLAGEATPPYRVRFRVQAGGMLPAVEETLDIDADFTPFSKDVILSAAGAPPGVDVPWSFEASVETTNGLVPFQFLGTVTLDVADPPPLAFLDPVFDGNPAFAAGSFTIEGGAEPGSTVQIIGFNGVDVAPGQLVPTELVGIGEGAEFRASVDISRIPDGEYSLDTAVVAASNRTGAASRRRVRFRVDRTPPQVVRMTVNGVDAAAGREVFVTGGQLVTLVVLMDEASPRAPEVYVTQQGAEAVRAVLAGSPVPGLAFEYQVAADPGGDFDGLAEVVVIGAADRAGNVNTTERRFPAAFLVDTRAPVPDSAGSRPPDGALLMATPGRIRISLREPADSPEDVAGPDPAASSIRVLGPIEVDPTRENPGVVTAFDPRTVDFYPDPGSLTDEGTYQVEITGVDRAGNTRVSVFIYRLDTTAPQPAFVLATDPASGEARRTDAMLMDSGRPAVEALFDVRSPADIDLENSTLELFHSCAIPRRLEGATATVPPDRRRFTPDETLAGDGSDDGVYTIRVRVGDPAGNMQAPVDSIFVLDNTPPVVLDGRQISLPGSPIPTVAGVFPARDAVVGGPLEHVSALIQDGVSRNGFTGSGPSSDPVTGTEVVLTLVGAHPTTTVPVGTSTGAGIISTTTFEEFPLDETSPCGFDLKRNRVLVNLFPDPLTGLPAGLPADGTFDGEYTLAVTPVDKAGNRGAPVTLGFTYDTVPPEVELDSVLSGRLFTGGRLALTGTARDNDKGPGDEGRGLARVQVRLEATSATGVTTLAPLVDFVDATLTPDPALVPAETTLPWRVDARIPAYEGPARLLVRAVDMAGNEAFLVRDLTLDVDPLPAPFLKIPRNRAALTGGLEPFEWEPVDGASGYEVTVTDAAGNPRVFAFDRAGTRVDINFVTLPEGPYTYTVRAVDTGGTRGAPAPRRSITVDRTAPAVRELFAIDGTAPDASAGNQYGNQLRFAVDFSEPMDPENPPEVVVAPANTAAGELPLRVLSLVGDRLRGAVDVPPSDGFPDVNGIATVIVRGGADLAGNPLPETRHFVEIDVGPFWEVRAFANPVLKREVIFHFRSRTADRGPLEDVSGKPHITIEQEGAVEPRQVVVREHTPSHFIGLYVVDRALPGTARIRITSSDPGGNTSTRELSFSVAAILRADETNLRFATGAARVRVPPGAVETDQVAVFVSPDMDGAAPPTQAHPELEMVRPLTGVVHGAVPLSRPARIDLDLAALRLADPAAARGLGVYLRRGERFEWQPARVEGGRLAAATRTLGPLALMRDVAPPRVALAGDASGARAGQTVRLEVLEQGSGLSPGTATARLGGRALAVREDPDGGLSLRLPRRVEPGESLEVAVADRAGNTGRAFLPVTASGGGLGEAALFPNPARTQAALRYQLVAPATAVRVRVYDAAGRRVRDLAGPTAAGRHRLVWDLRSRRGRLVTNGVYFVEVDVTDLAGARERRRLKLAVIR